MERVSELSCRNGQRHFHRSVAGWNMQVPSAASLWLRINYPSEKLISKVALIKGEMLPNELAYSRRSNIY